MNSCYVNGARTHKLIALMHPDGLIYKDYDGELKILTVAGILNFWRRGFNPLDIKGVNREKPQTGKG